MRKVKSRFPRRDALWKLAKLKQLGQQTDSILARRTRRTLKEAVAKRESRRIRLSSPIRRWTARENRLLGTMTDAKLARHLRRQNYQISFQRLRLKIR